MPATVAYLSPRSWAYEPARQHPKQQGYSSLKHYTLDTEALIPWFNKAVDWYVQNGPKNMPRPTTLPDCPLRQIEFIGQSSWGAFYVKNECFSHLDEHGIQLKGVSSHMMPLFAGIHQGYPTHILAKIIEHHGIEPHDFYDIYLVKNGKTKLFLGKDDIYYEALDTYIEAWKAFEMLGKVTADDAVSNHLQIAIMHTECKEAWPVTLFEQRAAERLGNPLPISQEYDFLSRWHIGCKEQLPLGNTHEYMRRSGMLSRPAFRKERSFRLWEDICAAAANEGKNSVARQLLDNCLQANESEKGLIREALGSMHLHGTGDIETTRIYEMLHSVFSGTDLESLLDSVILKINISISMLEADKHMPYIEPMQHLFQDVIHESQLLLSRACKEILALEPHQLGYAHFTFFNTFGRMKIEPQQLYGFSPEQVIVRLDDGLTDFIGARPAEHVAHVSHGPSLAFRQLSKWHTWDFSQLQGLSSGSQFKLVQEGANIRHFPNIDRKHRGMLLEDQLGL
jgi:hypothetical protein